MLSQTGGHGDDRAAHEAAHHGEAIPGLLARQLTLLIDGGLSDGVLDPDPTTPSAAKAAARIIVETACPARMP